MIGRGIFLIGTILGVANPLLAQASANQHTYTHAEIGVFAEDTRLAQTNHQNFWGAGVRFAIHLTPRVQVEAEGAYDFAASYDSQIHIDGSNTSIAYQQSQTRILHGLIGPKMNLTVTNAIRPYITVKGGFVNFSARRQLLAQAIHLSDGDTNGLIYPAAGVAFFLGRLGLRLEAGDEIYFSDGSNHSPRFSLSPEIRF